MKIKFADLPIVLLLSSLIVLSLVYLKSILVPIVLAILLSVAIAPWVGFLISRKVPKILAAILGISLIIGIFSAVVYLIVLEFGDLTERQELIMKKMSVYNDQIIHHFSGSKIGESFLKIYKKEVSTEEYLSKIFESTSSSISTSMGMLVNALLIPIYMFFFLTQSDFFVNSFRKIFKRFDTDEYTHLMENSKHAIQSYFKGFLKVTLIMALLNFLGLTVIGIENALFYSFLAAMLTVVPYIGVIIGSLLPAFIALVTKDSAWSAFAVIGWMSFVQFLEGNLITPKIVGDQLKINPFMVIVFLLIAGKIWGVVGLVVAIPMAAVFQEVCKHVPGLESLSYLIGSFPGQKTKQKSLPKDKLLTEVS